MIQGMGEEGRALALALAQVSGKQQQAGPMVLKSTEVPWGLHSKFQLLELLGKPENSAEHWSPDQGKQDRFILSLNHFRLPGTSRLPGCSSPKRHVASAPPPGLRSSVSFSVRNCTSPLPEDL